MFYKNARIYGADSRPDRRAQPRQFRLRFSDGDYEGLKAMAAEKMNLR